MEMIRRRWLVLVLVALALALCWWNFGEPRYLGRTARDWIAEIERNPAWNYTEKEEVQDAAKHLGAQSWSKAWRVWNAPDTSRPPSWLPGSLHRVWPGSPSEERREAAHAWLSSIPDSIRDPIIDARLAQLLKQPTWNSDQVRDVTRLFLMGTSTNEINVQIYLRFFDDFRSEMVDYSPVSFILFQKPIYDARIVNRLVARLAHHDSNDVVGNFLLLCQMGRSASNAVPVLLTELGGTNHNWAMMTLWKIGNDTNFFLDRLNHDLKAGYTWPVMVIPDVTESARGLAPVFRSQLHQMDPLPETVSAYCLWKIAPECAPEIAQRLGQLLAEPALGGDLRSAHYFEPPDLPRPPIPERLAHETLLEMGLAGAPAHSVFTKRHLESDAYSRFRVWNLLEKFGDGVLLPRRPELDSYYGGTPVLDGVLSPGEWTDATEFSGGKNWINTFSAVTNDADLSIRGWVKHDDTALYFAFDVDDDILYGIDTPRWPPPENSRAHKLSPQGFPWFGDELEILLNAGSIHGDEGCDGSSSSWQMVCNLTKSRLGGIGMGGLLEGEPRDRQSAWDTYQKWIQSGAQKAVVRVKPGGHGYVVEWSIRFDPCVTLPSGPYSPRRHGQVKIGLNMALGDLDQPEAGEGNFGHFHHEQWWAGSPQTRTQKNNFGTLVLNGKRRKSQAEADEAKREWEGQSGKFPVFFW